MIALTLAEVAALTGGTLHPATAGAVVVSGPATIDSRQAVAGGLFVALVGERTDGHLFVPQAQAGGAVAVLGTRPTELPTVVVADPTIALGALATELLRRLPRLRTHAMTGSQGKTGTKDYLAAILSAAGSTVATQGNFNNELGVPLTVLRAEASTRFLITEMGARGLGHIRYLASVARPDVAAVLNVGTAHVGEFGSQSAIAQAKGELVEALSPEGVAVLNADDPLTLAMRARTTGRVVTFGAAGEIGWRNLAMDEGGRPTFELRYAEAWHPLRLDQIGAHQVANAAAAAAMASAEEIDAAVVLDALATARPASRWRMERHDRADGLVVINDAYNANPASMAAALESLAAIGRATGRPTVAVLGEMRELGEGAAFEHRAIGELADRLGIGTVVTTGGLSAEITAAVKNATPIPMPSRDEAIVWVRQNVAATDVVLVKASRGVALEHLVAALLDSESSPDRSAPGESDGDRPQAEGAP